VLTLAGSCLRPGPTLAIAYRALLDIDPQHRGLLNFVEQGQSRSVVFSADRVAVFLPLADAMRGTWTYRRLILSGGSAAIAAIAGLWLVERAFDVPLFDLMAAGRWVGAYPGVVPKGPGSILPIAARNHPGPLGRSKRPQRASGKRWSATMRSATVEITASSGGRG
jgi:hypothetical protein